MTLPCVTQGQDSPLILKCWGRDFTRPRCACSLCGVAGSLRKSNVESMVRYVMAMQRYEYS